MLDGRFAAQDRATGILAITERLLFIVHMLGEREFEGEHAAPDRASASALKDSLRARRLKKSAAILASRTMRLSNT
jgi:hypothetical protein